MSGMWMRKATGWMATLVLAFVLSSCGGNPPPQPQPAPESEPQVEEESAEDAAAREAEERRLREEEERRRREAERRRVMDVLAERVHFDFDRSDIRADAEPVLQRKVSVLREHPGITLRIEGHADERGSNEYNLALGQRRSESVRSYLLSYGIAPGRFTTISYGEERPLAEGQNEEAWAMNRRAEFVVTDSGDIGTQ